MHTTTLAQRRRTQPPKPQPTPTKSLPAPTPTPEAKCTLTQAPELRGFRLGMSMEDAVARFRGLEVSPANEQGYTSLELEFQNEKTFSILGDKDQIVRKDLGSFTINRSKVEGFDNVDRIGLSFLDGRIFEIEIRYYQSVQWNSLDEFAATISKTLNLSGVWKPSSSYSRVNVIEAITKGRKAIESRTIECNAFRVSAFLEARYLGDYGAMSYYISPHVQIEDVVAENEFAKRIKDREEKKREGFKP
jgi:hypothetical protein